MSLGRELLVREISDFLVLIRGGSRSLQVTHNKARSMLCGGGVSDGLKMAMLTEICYSDLSNYHYIGSAKSLLCKAVGVALLRPGGDGVW